MVRFDAPIQSFGMLAPPTAVPTRHLPPVYAMPPPPPSYQQSQLLQQQQHWQPAPQPFIPTPHHAMPSGDNERRQQPLFIIQNSNNGEHNNTSPAVGQLFLVPCAPTHHSTGTPSSQEDRTPSSHGLPDQSGGLRPSSTDSDDDELDELEEMIRSLPSSDNTPPQQQLQQPHPTEDCNLFVSQLAPSVTERQLASTFGAVGPIASLKLMVHLDTGVSRGFAFVMFQKIEDARRAVSSLHGMVLGGQVISVRYVDRRLLRHPVVMGSPTKKVFVRNLPIDVTEAALRSVLPAVDTAVDVTLNLDRSSARRQMMAHVVFATVEQAQHAAEALHGTMPFANCPAPILTKVIDSHTKNRRRAAHKRQKQQQRQLQQQQQQQPNQHEEQHYSRNLHFHAPGRVVSVAG